MHSMNDHPPSVNRPEAGITLLPWEQLPWLRSRYVELLSRLDDAPAAVYVRAILAQIDHRLQQGASA
jgi:hypothetical protein